MKTLVKLIVLFSIVGMAVFITKAIIGDDSSGLDLIKYGIEK